MEIKVTLPGNYIIENGIARKVTEQEKQIEEWYEIYEQIKYTTGCYDDNARQVADIIVNDLDYRKQVQGEWLKHGYKWKCSHCGVLMDIDGTPLENLLFYCSNCGAKMKGAE